jgi:hypothetical protein
MDQSVIYGVVPEIWFQSFITYPEAEIILPDRPWQNRLSQGGWRSRRCVELYAVMKLHKLSGAGEEFNSP